MLRIIFTLSLLMLAGRASAHDLYLAAKPVSRTAGAARQVCAGIGENFPESENAVTADRITVFQLRSGSGVIPLKGAVKSKQFCASLPRGNGVIEMTIQPRYIRLPGKLFTEYISGEGLEHVKQARADAGRREADGRELYSRYAKLLDENSGALATKPLGHALEIVPAKDPASLGAGEPLEVQIFFKDKPLANVQVAAVYSGAKMEGHHFPVMTRTDAEGKATLKLDRPGLWYARIIYMEPQENDPEIDWRSYFATLTFTVPLRREAPAQ